MTRFLCGLVTGAVLGIALSASAAGVFGDGYLTGWTVTHDGEEVCTDPSVSRATREIECD